MEYKAAVGDLVFGEQDGEQKQQKDDEKDHQIQQHQKPQEGEIGLNPSAKFPWGKKKIQTSPTRQIDPLPAVDSISHRGLKLEESWWRKELETFCFFYCW